MGSKDIGAIKKGTNPMVWLMTVLNNSLGSTKVLVVIGVGVFLGIAEERVRAAVGYVSKGLETVSLTSKGG